MTMDDKKRAELMGYLKAKALWVRRETLKIHAISSETRVASSMSDVEIFVALYYGGVLRFDPKNTVWPDRDRLIVSKGHGAISLYPIFADTGYFDMAELTTIGKAGSFLGGIPDPIIPGLETVNGSLGHGLGVACGVALALRKQASNAKVFVLLGDGELYEGSVWEAIMFAAHHRLGNLNLIVDNNKICMLDYCKNVLDLGCIEDKFRAFGWDTSTVNDGHVIEDVYDALMTLKTDTGDRPNVLVANTVKGKGIPQLENDSLCHIKSLKVDEINNLLGVMQ
ncbi:transketolase domain-containing protein [Candidatus Magnetobacterium bavaricum]|uniref:Transketolase domain-containing protein n=1 Tax=Candidatus Magnetobacterium bavaricum TaxID=29290 RepID=A0A0F3GQ57_9BACT|nr:transketolase domain-containing protein [Candidatus Magnetobacterium bavaricum]